MRIEANPNMRIFRGWFVEKFPNLYIVDSIKLGFTIAFELGFHFKIDINAGIIVRDKTQAQPIPKASVIPYPFMPSKGEKINVKKADMVVMEVSDIGFIRLSKVLKIALLVFLIKRSSLKNLLIICTPSELAIVSNIIGIEV